MTEMSVHFERVETPITAIVNQKKPEYVLLVNPPTENPFPGIKTIGRFQQNDEYTNQGAAGADRWWKENHARVANCAFWLWGIVTCNEPQGDWVVVDAYVCRWIDLCHSLIPWLKTVAWNFSFGGPEAYTYPCFLESATKTDCYGFHEYWTPRQWVDFDAWQGWTYWRYKKFIAALPAALRDKPVFITECGIDMSKDHQGWRSNSTEIGYILQIAEYFEGLTPNVKAAFVYEAGSWPLWKDFELTESLATSILTLRKEEPVPVPVNNLIIDGRLMNAEQFNNHVKQTNLSWADTIVVHHTAKPTKADWALCGWECRKENMRLYYQNTLGWDSGPHLFVSDEGIGLFSPLSARGTGVTNQNAKTIHIEIVGDYSSNMPTGATYSNTISAIVSLWKKLPTALVTYHKALEASTACPGAYFIAHIQTLFNDVRKTMNLVDLSGEQPTATKIRWHVEQAVRELETMHIDPYSTAMQRLNELVKLDGGLLYRFEALHS
jgi:hypothetical protein